MTPDLDPILLLDAADPELAGQVRAALDSTGKKIDPGRLEAIAADTVEALSLEPSFGRAVGSGLAALAADTPDTLWKRYRTLIREAAGRGATFGRHIAESLVPVIRSGEPALTDRFMATVQVLAAKGTYTFPRTFEALMRLLDAGDIESAAAFLALLSTAFSDEISYNRSQQMTVALSRGVLSLSRARRSWQIRRLTDLCRTDTGLIEPFFEGIVKGLDLLSERALAEFSQKGLALFSEHPDRGRRFFSLESKLGADACAELQVTVALAQVREGLHRYLRARTGLPLAVRPVSSLPAVFREGPSDAVTVFSDSRTIYLPETVRAYSRRSENIRLYKLLVRLEACLHEFGTHDFDLEKALERIGSDPGTPMDGAAPASDLERFCSRFQVPSLAMDLFFILEQGRIRACLADRYPGLLRKVRPSLEASFEQGRQGPPSVLTRLYARLVLGRGPGKDPAGQAVSGWAALFDQASAAAPVVETAAVVTDRIYPEVARWMLAEGEDEKAYRSFVFPFGQRLRSDLFRASERAANRTAGEIKTAVEKQGRYRIYRADLVRMLRERHEPLTADALEKIAIPRPGGGVNGTEVDLSDLDLGPWLTAPEGVDATVEDTGGPVFWYREWDSRMDDYLQCHVRVRERGTDEDSGEFYARTLKQRRHLVGRIRTAFEMLKPEGLKILRQWIEGDAFDHRALIDFAVDRRAGRTPSERLYIKRLKQERDIGVLLLVDLSRSTANRVAGSTASVLDVEKEALVLFCEALSIVGDTFAVAGFSGTGRLGVDYYPIKAFDQETTEEVRARIGALTPMRSTRMGAAIRHATAQLEALDCRVKLLLIIGDGFPNDADYKQGYAIGDTRKAISEARAKQIHVRAITVNLPADPKLDELYGNVHHNVISDVRELPDRLLRIYSALTRC
ncbi:MAG: hypothetical protein PVG78_07420 [Desulfobacterales bacterium]|jgi:hypothetical protein